MQPDPRKGLVRIIRVGGTAALFHRHVILWFSERWHHAGIYGILIMRVRTASWKQQLRCGASSGCESSLAPLFNAAIALSLLLPGPT